MTTPYQPPTLNFLATSPGITHGNPSLFDLELNNNPTQPSYPSGWYDGWCADSQTVIYVDPAQKYKAGIYSSYEYNVLRANPNFITLGDANPAAVNELPQVPYASSGTHVYLENLDLVNWLLNNITLSNTTYTETIRGVTYPSISYYNVSNVTGNFTYGDIQQAIYQLLGDGQEVGNSFLGSYDVGRVTTIVNEAIKPIHEGYVPDVGQKIVVILDPALDLAGSASDGKHFQPLLITSVAAALGDYVWYDCNGNGIQDAGENGINGVTVNLVRDMNTNGTIEANEILATTTTGDNPHVAGTQTGYYEFKGLTPGLDYQVQFVKPTGYLFTVENAPNSTTATDSNANQFTGLSEVVVLGTNGGTGEFNHTIDAGLTKTQNCVTLDFSGCSATDGCDGNIRSYTVNGVSVHASAFSRADGATGQWETAYLGSYGGGLGVTNKHESGGNNTHTVDNAGGYNDYVLFEFAKTVNLEQAVLGYVVNDSDLQVWIGNFNNPYNNHLTLSDQVLADMGFTQLSLTTLTTTRTADLNPDHFLGNTIVIAAAPQAVVNKDGADYFKIDQLEVCAPVCESVCSSKATIGDRVWCDSNGNGIQDDGENGVSGVTVKLLDSYGNTRQTTTTGNNGLYSFSVDPGDYQIQFVKPAAYQSFTQANQGTSDWKDSDADSTGKTALTHLSAGENDITWDAGFAPNKTSLTYSFTASCQGGTSGNEFTVGGVTVKASAFSSSSSGTDWKSATLTLTGDGHGVSNSSTDGSSAVDNMGRQDYVVYQFSKNVVVDKAFLASVCGDSDVTAWVGSSSTPVSQSNISATLRGLTKEDNDTTSNYARWADLNHGSKEGNILVIAASTSDCTPDDSFRISKLTVCVKDASVTPIAIDLGGDGIQTVALNAAQGEFDLFGTGNAVKSGWLSGNDGFLAVDADHNGKIDSIAELFGGSKQGDGFARLAAFDSNGDRVLDANDADFIDLSVWRDANGNHQTDAGELISLSDVGVLSLNVDFLERPFMDAAGNMHLEQSSATLADGSVVDMTDVYFAVAANDAVTDAGWLFA